MPHRIIRSIIAGRSANPVTADLPVIDAAQLMRNRGVSALVVTEEGHPIGIFTERDALFRVLAAGLNPRTTPISQVMTPDPQAIHPDRPIGHALHLMYEGGFRHVPVVEDGVLAGVVTAADILGPELGEFATELDERDHIAEVLG